MTVRAVGDIDIASSPALRTTVFDLIETAGPSRVVFDLEQVSFIDSSGLAVLVNVENAGIAVEVQRPSAAARIAIQASGLSHLLGGSQ